jgi:hypothetical protein
VLFEIRSVATWVSNAVLRQEHAVGVVSPAWTGPSDVRRTKSFRQPALYPSLPDVFDEPAHDCIIAPEYVLMDHRQRRSNTRERRRTAGRAP